MSGRASAALLLVVAIAGGCAPRRVALPTGASVPYPGFGAAYQQATSDCSAVESMTATLGLSGRAGNRSLRGRVDAGLASPDRLRLELFPPLAFGNPAVILVTADGAATLLLPRDNRVLRDEPPEAIVEALAGVPLGPAELRRIVAGCGLHADAPVEGRSYDGGWVAADAGESTVYLRQLDGRWRVAGAARGSITVQYTYANAASSRPQSVNIRAAGAAGPADITLALSDVQLNVPLGPEVFEARVPGEAVPLTLAELKRAMGQQ